MSQVFKSARVNLPKPATSYLKAPSKKIAVGCFHWAENGGTGRWTPYVRCTGVGHVSFLEFACQFLTTTCNTPDALQVHTGRVRSGLMRREFVKLATSPDAGHRTVRCSPDSCAERVAKTPVTPDANHWTLLGCVRCSTLAGSSTPDSEASVRCLRTQRPVSVSH